MLCSRHGIRLDMFVHNIVQEIICHLKTKYKPGESKQLQPTICISQSNHGQKLIAHYNTISIPLAVKIDIRIWSSIIKANKNPIKPTNRIWLMTEKQGPEKAQKIMNTGIKPAELEFLLLFTP